MPTRPDPIQEQLDTLKSSVEDVRASVDRQAEDYDKLNAKLGPGTKFLVDLEERVVYNATLTATKNTVTTAVVETLPGALHAAYRVSYQPTEASVIVVGNGTGTIPTNGCAVALGREYKTSPVRIEVTVRITNTDAANDHPIALKIWKRMGMGS